MMKAHKRMRKEDFVHHTRSADRLIEKLEADRDLSKSWLHVDMDGETLALFSFFHHHFLILFLFVSLIFSSIIAHLLTGYTAFYASVEIRDDPELAGIPMAVGSMSMLCTSIISPYSFPSFPSFPSFLFWLLIRLLLLSGSYEARKFGVRSGMYLMGHWLLSSLLSTPSSSPLLSPLY